MFVEVPQMAKCKRVLLEYRIQQLYFQMKIKHLIKSSIFQKLNNFFIFGPSFSTNQFIAIYNYSIYNHVGPL